MDNKGLKRRKTTLAIFRLLLLFAGSAFFTAAAYCRYQLNFFFLDDSLYCYILIAAIWIFETVCAIVQMILLPDIREPKLYGHDRTFSKNPYGCLLLALRRIETGENADALEALERVDTKRLRKKGQLRYTTLKALAEAADSSDADKSDALFELSLQLSRDIDRIESLRKMLGSLPRAALLSLLLLGVLYFYHEDPRCVELRSTVSVSSMDRSDQYTVKIKGESGPGESADEYAVHVAFQSYENDALKAEAENELFIQSPAPGNTDYERFNFPATMTEPDFDRFPLPDTADFRYLIAALSRAVKNARGEPETDGGAELLKYTVSVSASTIERLLTFHFSLYSAELYKIDPVWEDSLCDLSMLSEDLPAYSETLLPVTVLTDSSGKLIQADIDTGPLIAELLKGSSSRNEPGLSDIRIRCYGYSADWVVFPNDT